MRTVAEMIQAIFAHGLSAEMIAERVGKSVQAVHSWATGKVTNPHRQTRERIEALYRSVVGGQADLGAALSPSAPIQAERGDPVQPVISVPVAAIHPEPAFDAAPLPDRHASPPPRTGGEAFRFIHCADLHIDSPLHGLRKIDPRYASWIRTATRQAFARLVDMAIADAVHFVVIAGDLYDGDWKSADTGIFVSRQLSRLTDAGIPVFAITGNHDALSVVTRSVTWPANAHRFDATAASIEIPELDVVIHGRSFGDRYESTDFVGGYPPPRAGKFNLGLLHTSLGGAAGHATYAPCSPAQLAAIGYDYWALGHVHAPREVQKSPSIVYSGNIQGRDIGETGPRGCFVVTVDRERRPAPYFVPLDDVRWERIEISLDEMEAETPDDVVAAAITAIEARVPRDERLLACRVVLRGETPLHRQLVGRRGSLREEVATAAGSQLERVCLEEVLVETSDPATTTDDHGDVPRRAISLIGDEFKRLEAASLDALLEEAPELKKLFEDIRLLDSMRPGRRDELRTAGSWNALLGEARQVLEAHLGRSVGETEETR
jgi:exonuclease SbcD